MKKIRIVIAGAAGKMGKRINALAAGDPELEVIAGVDLKPDGKAGIVDSIDKVTKPYDCIVEFTSPQATVEHVKKAVTLKKPMVIGTTGLGTGDIETIRRASNEIPVVFSPNMSVGVNTMFMLIEKASETLTAGDYKVSINEAHHIHKKDKPSGTAKFMADIVKSKRGDAVVPVESQREGEIIGDHEIIFESPADTVRISHSAKTRDIFALGALRAAKFVAFKKNGLFRMTDVLGEKI